MAQSVAVAESSQANVVSETVVSAVAELTDTDPLSLEPLYTAVDPDALNALFEREARSPTRVEFTYCECEIVVTAEGSVRVSKPDLGLSNVKEWA